MTTQNRPPVEQSEAYLLAFDHFNEHLFGNCLPRPMLTFSRQHPRFKGHFSPARWTDADGHSVDEIALNANALAATPLDELMVVLVHEMVHLAQHHHPDRYGKNGHTGYHSAGFFKTCTAIGLHCQGSGRSVHSTAPTDGTGPWWNAYASMPEEALLPYQAHDLDPNADPGSDPSDPGSDPADPGQEPAQQPEPQAKKTRTKYVCPACGAAAWGGRNLSLVCGSPEHPAPMPMAPTGAGE